MEEEVAWTWDEFLALPRTEVNCDIHCVTRWSRLDNRFHARRIQQTNRSQSDIVLHIAGGTAGKIGSPGTMRGTVLLQEVFWKP